MSAADEKLSGMGFRFVGTSQDGMDLVYQKFYTKFTHIVTIRSQSVYGTMIFSVESKNGFRPTEPIGLSYDEMRAFCEKIEELKRYSSPCFGDDELDDGK